MDSHFRGTTITSFALRDIGLLFSINFTWQVRQLTDRNTFQVDECPPALPALPAGRQAGRQGRRAFIHLAGVAIRQLTDLPGEVVQINVTSYS